MPFQISWYQPERIVLMEIEGVLTTAEVRNLITDSGSMVDTRRLQKIESVPDALKTVQGNPPHPNMGWMIVVGTMNPLVKFFIDFVGMITRSRYRRFDTLPDALAFLRDIDKSLVPA